MKYILHYSDLHYLIATMFLWAQKGYTIEIILVPTPAWGVCVCGFHSPQAMLQTPAGCLRLQLSSDTIDPESASDPMAEGSVL